MVERFHIEDLVAQDSSGVVFRALDTLTNQPAAVLRFFPFGPNGGGLRDDEQTAYTIAVGRLAGVSHPALRSVVGGGCDPVDGMPYIATEWIDGIPLQSFIERGPLTPAEAAGLVTQALEVCELLSQVLAEEAVWVETDLQTIIVGAEGSGVTFRISPLKWLFKNDRQRGLVSIVRLTEDVMGWTGKAVPVQAGRGLGGWLKWLRGSAKTATLQEARVMLAAAMGAGPPVPAKKPARHAARPPAAARKGPALKAPLVACLVLLATGLGGWALVRRHSASLGTAGGSTPPGPEISETETPSLPLNPPEPAEIVSAAAREKPVPAATRFTARPVDQVNREAAEMSFRSQESADIQKARRLQIQRRGDIFEVGDRELLLEKKGSQVQLEGRLAGVRFSANGKGTKLYLEFSKPAANDEPRGYMMKKDLPAGMNPGSLEKFKGKKVRLRGKVNTPISLIRPEIKIKNLAAIEEVE